MQVRALRDVEIGGHVRLRGAACSRARRRRREGCHRSMTAGLCRRDGLRRWPWRDVGARPDVDVERLRSERRLQLEQGVRHLQGLTRLAAIVRRVTQLRQAVPAKSSSSAGHLKRNFRPYFVRNLLSEWRHVVAHACRSRRTRSSARRGAAGEHGGNTEGGDLRDDGKPSPVEWIYGERDHGITPGRRRVRQPGMLIA